MSDQPPEQPLSPESPAEPPVAVEPPQPHPVRLVVKDDLKRSRLTVFFRLILAIPHLLWIWIWSYIMLFCVIVNWFVTLIRGRSPDDLHLLLARAVRYSAHLTAYVTLIGNPYPTFFGREGAYPVDLEVAAPERQSRWVTGFRMILAIPAVILTSVFQQVLEIVAFLGWFVCLALGRMPKGMRDLQAYCLRYQSQTFAYLFLLTARYPSLVGVTP